jgi:hypothetical protein
MKMIEFPPKGTKGQIHSSAKPEEEMNHMRRIGLLAAILLASSGLLAWSQEAKAPAAQKKIKRGEI